MSSTELELIAFPVPMDAERRLAVHTPFLGDGVLSIGEDRVRVSWDNARLPGIGSGLFVATVDVKLDTEGRWTVGDASVQHADGRPLERLKVDAVKERLGDWAPSEGLSAVAEGFLVYPNALLHALREAEPYVEDAALAAGVDRIVEMLGSNPRLSALAEAVDARRREPQPIRDRLEELAFTMREAHAPSF